MSYILDTLKKLEKEKSEFSNRLDLKKLILKEEEDANSIKILRKRSHTLTFVILAIAVFFFLNFFVFKFPFPPENSPGSSNNPKEKNISAQTQTTVLSKTSDRKMTFQDVKPVKESKNNVSGTGNVEVGQNKKPAPVSKDDNTLKTKKQRVTQKITNREKKSNISKQETSSIISRDATPQNISDIRISGIVFFGEGVSLNYAIASYKGKNRIKLKEGGRLDDIEILKIKSGSVLMMLQNKVFEKKLGK